MLEDHASRMLFSHQGGRPYSLITEVARSVYQQRRSLLTLPDGHRVLMLSAHLPAFDPLALSPAI